MTNLKGGVKRMRRQTVECLRLEELTLYGLWQPSSDQSVARDIPALSRRYRAAIQRQGEQVLPFYVLSRDYDEASGRFSLFVGNEQPHPALRELTLPTGLYGKMVVRPRWAFLWGAAVGAAKRYFYTQWLPGSPYRACGLEFERHTEKSLGRRPSVDLLFSIREKTP